MDRRNRILNYPTSILIKTYQKLISPVLVQLFGNSCRFQPTCSQYSHDAMHKYGIAKGIYLTIYRVLRCSPFSKGGYDPA